MLKGKTTITVNRDTLKAVLEEHVQRMMLVPVVLKEFTVHRSGTIDLVVTPAEISPAVVDSAPAQSTTDDGGTHGDHESTVR